MSADKNFRLSEFKTFFKNPEYWHDDLIAIGGDFDSERLLYAYKNGIFPWSENPIRWYSLDPRAVFDLDGLHISRTVRKKIKQGIYKVTFNRAFLEVMKGCSFRIHESTWITEGFLKGYLDFHNYGYAHSAEAWDKDNNLVGGVYGIAIGKLFAGESMFARSSDAGKVALVRLFEELKKDGFSLFDTQQLNETTWSLGAYEIPKLEYLRRLKEAVRIPYKWQPPILD